MDRSKLRLPQHGSIAPGSFNLTPGWDFLVEQDRSERRLWHVGPIHVQQRLTVFNHIDGAPILLLIRYDHDPEVVAGMIGGSNVDLQFAEALAKPHGPFLGEMLL